MEDHPLPRHSLPKDASEIEAIADLQTARLALRWALERIRSVEKERASLQERADADLGGKRAALDDLGALQRTFNYYAARLQEAEELSKTLEARLETAAAEAARKSEPPTAEWPAPPPQEALESPAVGENVLSIRQSYEERLSVLKAEHAKGLVDLRNVVEEAASQTVRKVQAMAQTEKERSVSQADFERENGLRAVAALERKHQAELVERERALERDLAAAEPALMAKIAELRSRLEAAGEEVRRLTAAAQEERRASEAAEDAGRRRQADLEVEDRAAIEAELADERRLRSSELAARDAAHGQALKALDRERQAVIESLRLQLESARNELRKVRELDEEEFKNLRAQAQAAADRDREHGEHAARLEDQARKLDEHLLRTRAAGEASRNALAEELAAARRSHAEKTAELEARLQAQGGELASRLLAVEKERDALKADLESRRRAYEERLKAATLAAGKDRAEAAGTVPSSEPEPRGRARRLVPWLAAMAVLAPLAWWGAAMLGPWPGRQGRQAGRSVSLPFAEPAGVASRGGALIIGDWQRQTLLEVGEDGAVRSVERVPNPNLTGLAFSDSSLWTSDAGDGAVYEHAMDPGHAVIRAFRNKDQAPSALAWAPGRLWAADLKTRTIYEYSVGEKLSVARQITLPGVRPVGLKASEDRLWVLDGRSRKLLRYRLAGRPELEASLDLGPWLGPGSAPAGFVLDGGALWVVTSEPPALHRFDLESLPWMPERAQLSTAGYGAGGMKQ